MSKILVVLLVSSLLLSGCSMEDNIAVNILNNIKGDTTESTESSEVQEQEQTDNIDNYIPSVEEAAKEQGLVYDKETKEDNSGIDAE